MDGVEKLGLLSAMEIFSDLSETEIESLMDSTSMSTAKKGTVFYGSKDGPEVLFLLKSGRVELYRQLQDDKRLTVAVVEERSFFGEMSLVGQQMLGTMARALEDSVICAMSQHDVRALMLEHPTVAVRVIEALAARLQQSRDALEEMAFSDVTGRVAGLLLRLSDGITDVIEGYSHQDLAAMIGCLRESVTVTLDRFKESGAVAIGRKRIEITDRSQLESVVSQRAPSAS
ncbi:MAG: Crp/Fnr family transcriptional regulator [Chloroflexi bacterium]|nr:Crp/Fnr family transcriptional regulator [Chloroflexota bacterium]